MLWTTQSTQSYQPSRAGRLKTRNSNANFVKVNNARAFLTARPREMSCGATHAVPLIHLTQVYNCDILPSL